MDYGMLSKRLLAMGQLTEGARPYYGGSGGRQAAMQREVMSNTNISARGGDPIAQQKAAIMGQLYTPEGKLRNLGPSQEQALRNQWDQLALAEQRQAQSIAAIRNITGGE